LLKQQKLNRRNEQCHSEQFQHDIFPLQRSHYYISRKSNNQSCVLPNYISRLFTKVLIILCDLLAERCTSTIIYAEVLIFELYFGILNFDI